MTRRLPPQVLALLTVRVTSPIRRKAWWISDHQAAGVARTMGDGEWSGTQRELQSLLGYSSLGGVQRWLRMLRMGGLASWWTAKGRHGRTRIRFVRGVTCEMYAHVPLPLDISLPREVTGSIYEGERSRTFRLSPIGAVLAGLFS